MNKFTFNRLNIRYAAPLGSETLEQGVGGVPLVASQGLNTNQGVNFSGLQVDTSGNLTTPGAMTATGGITNGGGTVTGPTGSFGNLTVRNIATGATASFGVIQITSAPATGPTGTTAALGPVGAADGGPTTTAQAGWTTLTVGGTKYYVPIWS